MPQSIPFFDGHNDTLLRLFGRGRDDGATFFEDTGEGHLDFPRARRAGMKGGFFAIFVPNAEPLGLDGGAVADPYQRPVDATPELAQALQVTLRLAAGLFELERRSGGALRVCRSSSELRDAIAADVFAAILHIEGAEAIDANLDALHVLHQAGLRSLGPVWSRPNRFAEGVPFRFPSSPDTGAGLTEAGRDLVRTCNELGVLLDLSHLNEKGFFDVARLSDAPLVATHSNAHAISASSRNLTDGQLQAIRDSGGVVGVNYATGFLNPDGKASPDTSLDVMVRHFDHLLGILGEEGVALGSDFDGAGIPAAIGDVQGVQNLLQALRNHGYDEALLQRIALDNWLAVLERTWR
jgi:membrane dipeptidase